MSLEPGTALKVIYPYWHRAQHSTPHAIKPSASVTQGDIKLSWLVRACICVCVCVCLCASVCVCVYSIRSHPILQSAYRSPMILHLLIGPIDEYRQSHLLMLMRIFTSPYLIYVTVTNAMAIIKKYQVLCSVFELVINLTVCTILSCSVKHFVAEFK